MTLAQLQNIANGHGWIGLTYWNGGTAQVHSPGTAIDAAASGPLGTRPTGGSSCAVWSPYARGQGKSELSQITVSATETSGPEHHPDCRPCQPMEPGRTGRWIWNAPGNAWSLPVAGADSSGVCTLSLGVGTSTPIADPSLPPAY